MCWVGKSDLLRESESLSVGNYRGKPAIQYADKLHKKHVLTPDTLACNVPNVNGLAKLLGTTFVLMPDNYWYNKTAITHQPVDYLYITKWFTVNLSSLHSLLLI